MGAVTELALPGSGIHIQWNEDVGGWHFLTSRDADDHRMGNVQIWAKVERRLHYAEPAEPQVDQPDEDGYRRRRGRYGKPPTDNSRPPRLKCSHDG